MAKRVLIVSEVFYPETTMLNDFVLELIERGFCVEVLTQHPSYPYGKVFEGYENNEYCIDSWNGVRIHRFKVIEGYKESKLKKILNYWAFVSKGTKIAKKIGANFDHIFVYQTGPLTLALPAISIKRKFDIRLTIWTFDIWPDAVYAYGFPAIFPLRLFLSKIIKRVYSNADNILVSSIMFKDSILEYVPNKSIYYAPNWIIHEKQKDSTLEFDQSKFNYLFAGNISKAQNLENVIEGWHLAGLSDKAVLNIIGDGSCLADLQDLVLKKNIKGVLFHGRLPSNEMQSVMKKCSTLILSLVPNVGISKTEPFKLQAYLQSGKPIFGVIQGAGKTIIEENALGICSSPDDIHNIAAGFINSMQFAEKNAGNVKVKSIELIKSRFCRERTISKLISLINNL